MALFPKVGPEFFEEKDSEILSSMEKFYLDSLSINQAFWAEADIDARFEAGDQNVLREVYNNVPLKSLKNFNFNRIKRVVNMISGHQRKNRKSIIAVPIENGDEVTADQFSKVIMWANQQDSVLDTISEAFHGALVSGMNLLQVWCDYRSDPVSGNIRVNNCSYNGFMVDPLFKKKDLSDCNGIWKRAYLSRNECISLMPDKKEIILGLSGINSRDEKFQYMPENIGYDNRDLVIYDEYHYRSYRKQRMLIDSQTGECMEWRSNDEDALRQFLSLYPQVTVDDQEIPTVRLALVVQGKVLYNDVNPMGIDTYPFVPVFGYYNPHLQDYSLRVQGVVRGLRDAQFLYNRRKTIELDILESQINSGIKYKEDALVNPKDAFMSGQGRGLALKQTAQMSDVEQMMPPQIPPSMIQLSEILGREIQEISGVNEELLGSALDDKAGVLSMLRQGAGLTTLQILFDHLDNSQKLLGKLMIDIIQSNFTPGKIKRIIEDEPSPQFYNKAFGKYDAAIEEGLNTTTQRQMQFAQLLQLREVGVPVPDEVLIEAATVQDKKQLTEAINAQNEQKAQAEQMQLQAAIQEQQARTELARSRSFADQGLGAERISRIEENRELATERRAEAQKDRTQGVLNLVKTLQEIDEIDIAQIEKLIKLTQIMKTEENVEESQAQKAPFQGQNQQEMKPSQEELRS